LALTSLLQRKGRIFPDLYRTVRGPRALVSTIDRPFRKGASLKHNNLTEALEMAAVLHELGHVVDVVDHTSRVPIDYSRYRVVFGFGTPLESLFWREAAARPRTILYCNSEHTPALTATSLHRLEEVFRKRGVWLPGSARIGAGGIAAAAVDGLVVLGNGFAAESFRPLTRKPIHSVPLFYYRVADADAIVAGRDLAEAGKHFAWFAGSGLVHKGLDLVLEAFARQPRLHLHVYGAIDTEPGFVQAYRQELYQLPNVHVEGFLPLDSPGFAGQLRRSAFMVCPSCSEGCCSAVLNICGNGGNVPVLTRQCGIDLGDFGVLVGDTTVAAVEAALLEAAGLGPEELGRRCRAAAAHFQREHSLERFHQRLKEAVQDLLEGSPA